jgi:hypothetical protein
MYLIVAIAAGILIWGFLVAKLIYSHRKPRKQIRGDHRTWLRVTSLDMREPHGCKAPQFPSFSETTAHPESCRFKRQTV